MSRIKSWCRRWWRRFLARHRIDLTAVCEESRGMGLADFHDYPDDVIGTPAHFVELECRRCDKRFTM